jgi:hypothetical protein
MLDWFAGDLAYQSSVHAGWASDFWGLPLEVAIPKLCLSVFHKFDFELDASERFVYICGTTAGPFIH